MKQFPMDVYGVDRVDVLHEDKLHVNLSMPKWKKRYIYSPIKWLLNRLNIAWQWNEVKYEAPLTYTEKIRYQIEYLTSRNIVPAYVLVGPKAYSEIEAEFFTRNRTFDLRPYEVGIDYTKVEIPFGKMAAFPDTSTPQTKAQAAKVILDKMGGWADTIELGRVDYGKGIKVQAMAVFGLHVFRVAWLDGVIVMPHIRGVDAFR